MTLPKKPTALPVRLHLEILEARELLNASFEGIATPAVLTDVSQFRNDLASAPYVLLNATQQPQLTSRWQAELNTLVSDYSKTWQDFENSELSSLLQTPLGQAFAWAESVVNRIAADAAAVNTMFHSLFQQTTLPESGPTSQALSSPAGASTNSSSSPPSTIRPLIGPQPNGGSNHNAPVANNDSYTISHDMTASIDATNGVLANDTDPNGLTLSAVFVSGPSDGTVTLNSNGSFTYIPKAHWTGTDSFQYYATDGQYISNTATVTLDVQNTGSVTAQADSYSTPHDQPLSIDGSTGVLANDSDSDGDTLTASLTSGPSNGTLQLNADGSFTYTPNSGYADSFTYTAGDGVQSSAPTTVSISVTNTAPTASNHTYGFPENTARSVAATNGLMNGANDADGDYLALQSWTQPGDGALQVNPDGSFTYTPNTNFTGSDGFQYTISDGAATATATVTLSVHASNTAPVANADSYSVERNNEFAADPSTGVLANDTDAEGDPLSATLVTGPTHGTLTLNADGSFAYTPNTNFTGTDSFTYKASDGVAASVPATVTLTTSASAPGAANQGFDVVENTALNGLAGSLLLSASNPDYMTLTAQDVTQPTNGTVTVNANGAFVYTPTSGFTGSDSFTYDVTDGSLTSSPVTVTVIVNASDTAPTASNLTYTVDENNSLSNDGSSGVLSGASDSDNDRLFATLVSGPSNGTLTLNLDGSFTYTPNANFTGADSFQYKAFDGSGYSNAATVTITVTSDVPTANPAPGVLAAASDADGLPLSATLVSGVAHGNLTLNADGSFSYSPNTGFTGTDSFTYEANNGVANSNVAMVTLNVHTTNVAPIASNDTYSTASNTPLTLLAAGGVLVNDSDSDHDTLTAHLVSSPSHGSLSLNSDGSFTYTPNNNFMGTDSFTYQANDGLTNSNTATVTLSVTDNAPSAADISYTIAHDQSLTVRASTGILSSDSTASASPLTANLVSGPSNGTLQVSSSGNLIYTPDKHFAGTDSFTYETNDGMLNSAPATVLVYVTNAAPVAADDNYSTTSGNTLVVAASGVLANDDDPDGDSMTAQLVSGPTNGSLTLNSNGSFTYIPHSGFSGKDSFTYQASDGVAPSNTATVTITVMAANATAPVANNDLFATGMNQPLTTNAPGVLWNAVAPAGKTLTAVLASGPANGTLTLNSNGSFTYTPNAGFTGTDSFTYYASASGVQSAAPATATIQISNIILKGLPQWIPINANDDNNSPITNMIPKVRDYNYLRQLGANDLQLQPLDITIKNPQPLAFVELGVNRTSAGTGTIRFWSNQLKTRQLLPGFYPAIGPGALPSTIYVEGVTPSSRVITGNSIQAPPTPDNVVSLTYWMLTPFAGGGGLPILKVGYAQTSVGVTPVTQFFTINNQPQPPNLNVPKLAGRVNFGNMFLGALGTSPGDSLRYGYQTYGINPGSKPPGAPVLGQAAATFQAQVFDANVPGSLHFIQNETIMNGGFRLWQHAWNFAAGGPDAEDWWWSVNGNLEDASKNPRLDMAGNQQPNPAPYYQATNVAVIGTYQQIIAGDSPNASLQDLVNKGLTYDPRRQPVPVSQAAWAFMFTMYLDWSMPAGGGAGGDVIYSLVTRSWTVAFYAISLAGDTWANLILWPSGVAVSPGDFILTAQDPKSVSGPTANRAALIR